MSSPGTGEKYDAQVGKALVEAKSRGAKEYRFDMKGQPMVVDFRTMQQTNLKTGKSRPVREAAAAKKPAPKPSAPAAYPKLHKPTPGDIYVHHTPSAPPAPLVVAPTTPVAPTPVAPTTPEKTEAKKAAETKKRSGPGFFSGMAAGTVAAAGAGVGIALATGAITTEDIGDVAADVGDAMAGVAADVGDAVLDAAEDAADFVTG